MNLTRRGWGLVALVVLALYMAASYGSRSINALVVPAILSLLAGVVQTLRFSRPSFRRTLPDEAPVGGGGTVRLHFDRSSPIAATVEDSVDAGLRARGNRQVATVDGDPLSYEVEYLRRGRQRFGPLSMTVRDVLGLVETTVEYTGSDSVLVYPELHSVAPTRDLGVYPTQELHREREEFEGLREYDRNDSLRDVHWKSSAKRTEGDLVVKEFTGEDERGDVVVACEASGATADEVASATASVVVALLDAGFTVGLRAENGRAEAAAGEDHRRDLLRTLALTGSGPLRDADRDAADVLVDGTSGRVSVETEHRRLTYDELLDGAAAGGATGSTGEVAA